MRLTPPSIGLAMFVALVLAATRIAPRRRVDLVIGWIFLATAAYYLYRVLSGTVVTSLPGEPGGGLS